MSYRSVSIDCWLKIVSYYYVVPTLLYKGLDNQKNLVEGSILHSFRRRRLKNFSFYWN